MFRILEPKEIEAVSGGAVWHDPWKNLWDTQPMFPGILRPIWLEPEGGPEPVNIAAAPADIANDNTRDVMDPPQQSIADITSLDSFLKNVGHQPQLNPATDPPTPV